MILGLDVSTSATGFAVIDSEGELVFSSYVDTRNKRKFPDIFEVCLCIKQELEKIKEQFDIGSIHNSATARKLCGIKVPRGKNTKEHVLKHVLGVEPNFIVEYTRTGTHKPYCYDKADAYVVAKSAWIACRVAQ